MLREQLSPFDASLTHTTQSLNWSSTHDALSRLIGGGGFSLGSSLLSLSSTTNPLLAFLKEGMPTVAESRVDFKRELEDLLRTTCEGLIAKAAALCVGRVAAWLGAGGAGASAAVSASASPATYATAVTALCEATLRDLIAVLPPLRRRLGLVLGSPMTAAILFRPMRERSLVQLFALRQHVHEHLSSEVKGEGESPQPQTSLRGGVEAALLACVAAVEASDCLVTDPLSSAFGYDTAVFTQRLVSSAPPPPAPAPLAAPADV